MIIYTYMIINNNMDIYINIYIPYLLFLIGYSLLPKKRSIARAQEGINSRGNIIDI